MVMCTTLTVFLLLVLNVFGQEQTQCYEANGIAVHCEPPTQSFSFNQVPEVNSTCGFPPTEFCTRQYSPILTEFTSDCSAICDADSSVNSHPPSLMTDFLLNEESWWQSENNFDTQNVVVIELSLQTLVQVEVIRFNFASFMPNSFYILKSEDFGQTYAPYHYFAVSCIDAFGVEPDQMLDIANETTILCQSITLPPAPGAKSFFPRLGRPSANDSIPGYSHMLFDFLTATNIRVVLAEHYPIPDLAPNDFGYYYAISDLNVVGSCQCNGHASACARSPTTHEYECVCQHNTAGQFCERCADFYQDRPWHRANGNGDIECQICSCNGHSTVCVFDSDVYSQSGETSGGVCIDCQDNTAGRQCDQCAAFHYQIPGLDISDVNACQPCNCNLAGVTDDGECTQGANQGVEVGQCFCKSQVIGQACEQCMPGFFNLTTENPDGCQECNCNSTGSLSTECNAANGVCQCKLNIVGDKCDQCLPNFYLPNPISSEGCLPCNCNSGGSFNSQCDMISGQCVCKQGIQGRTCSKTINGYFYPSIDYLRLEAEESSSNRIVETSGENERFTGTGYARITSTSDRLELGYLTVPVSGLYIAYIRYNIQGITMWDSVTLSITSYPNFEREPFSCGESIEEITTNTSIIYSSWPMGSGVTNSFAVCLRAGQNYNYSLHDFSSGLSGNPGTFDIDSLFIVPIFAPSLPIFDDAQIVSDYMDCINEYSHVITRSSANPSCAFTIFTISAAVYNGALECGCDETGSQRGTTCEAFGGKCFCLPGVRGCRCDQCSPSYYNLNTSGCSRCDCDVDGSISPHCNSTSGVCQCIENIVGRDCSSCAEGFRNLGGLQCFSCNCSLIGAVNTNCDDAFGLCECKPGVTGVNCDRCEQFHYGFQESGCRSCDCNTTGSFGKSCDSVTGQCKCVTNVMDRDCSLCQFGTFNLQESNPNGCQSCFCAGLTSQCSAADGFVRSSVSTLFNSSAVVPLDGWQLVTANENDTIEVMQGGAGIVIPGNLEGRLLAPNQFLGNKLSSYSQYLQVSMAAVAENYSIDPIFAYDVVLVRENIQLGAYLLEIDDGLFSIQFHEIAGWLHLNSSTPASLSDLQYVLLSLNSLYISINFNTEVLLSQIRLDTAVRSSGPGEQVSWVEECECPLGYAGLSCERCAQGYTKTAENACKPCQCNGFSNNCDPGNGVCINCSQATEGPTCEICQQGFFGDPTRNISCKPCPCPLPQPGAQFSDECILLPNGEAMCTNCPSGHAGENCEFCRTGYFGDPTGRLTGQPSMCIDCLCNGNINLDDPLSCNATTGSCTRCLGNTAGDQCERCADGFYGDAMTSKNCTDCDCEFSGSESSVCNMELGQCACLPNVIGRSCDRCTLGYFGFGQPSGCLPCNCDTIGSVSSQCDDSGQCTCLPGVTGENCDQCLQGYFNFTTAGCQECSCSQFNSQSVLCETDGVCNCLPGSTGSDCRDCIRNYFQTSQTEICRACPSCYQEIGDKADGAEGRYFIAQNRLTELQDMLTALGLGPFNPRFADKQQLVGNIVTVIDALSARETNLTNKFNTLVRITVEVLQSQSTSIQFSLETLKSTSTTVLILASTSNELLDRIINEFLSANSFLDIFRNELLPSIQTSSYRIQASLDSSVNVSQAITESVQFVSGQVAEIQNNLIKIATFLTNAQQEADTIFQLFRNTSASINDLYEILDAAIVDSNRIASMVNGLTSNLQMFQNQIYLLRSVPDCPPEEILQELTSLSRATETDVSTDISNELSNQRVQLYALNQTLSRELSSFKMLQARLAVDESRVFDQSNTAKDLPNKVYEIVDSVAEQIELAETILRNLLDFNNNSLQISLQANMALQHVTSINESAALTLSEAELFQKQISEINGQVNTTKAHLSKASDRVSSAQQDVMSLRTSSLVKFEASNIKKANSTVNTVRELSSEVQIIHSTTNDVLSNIDDLAESVADIETGLNTTLAASGTTQSAVHMLQDAFDQLELPDPKTINILEALLSDVLAEFTLANIEVATLLLHDKIEKQRQQRMELETKINTVQEQVDYLQQVQSNLPTKCII